MITIEKVYKEKVYKEKVENNKTRLSANFNIDGECHNLWYEVSDEYADYLLDRLF